MNSPISGPALKEWREKAGLTQEELGCQLGVTREWIGKLETSERPISANIHLKLETLKREQEFAASQRPDQPGTQAAHDSQSAQGTLDALRQEIRNEVEKAIAAAGDNRDRLGWLKVQVETALEAYQRWNLSPEEIGEVDRIRALIRSGLGTSKDGKPSERYGMGA